MTDKKKKRLEKKKSRLSVLRKLYEQQICQNNCHCLSYQNKAVNQKYNRLCVCFLEKFFSLRLQCKTQRGPQRRPQVTGCTLSHFSTKTPSQLQPLWNISYFFCQPTCSYVICIPGISWKNRGVNLWDDRKSIQMQKQCLLIQNKYILSNTVVDFNFFCSEHVNVVMFVQ